jgi:hypothetical protein
MSVAIFHYSNEDIPLNSLQLFPVGWKSLGQDTARTVRNPKIQCRLHKSPSLDLTLILATPDSIFL